MQTQQKFSHNFLPRFDCIRIESDDARMYQTPDGKLYPSVTTVLGYVKPQYLIDWQNKVGIETANKIATNAARRGTAMHDMCEKYLLNKEVPFDMFYSELFNSIKPLLNRINNIRLLESPLYSHILRMAGTVDCLGDFDGVSSLIDFKSSTNLKSHEDVISYWLQTTAYSAMILELYGIKVKQLVLIIAVEDSKPLIFIDSPSKYVQRLFELRKNTPI